MEAEETGGCWPETRMVRSSLVLGMQHDIAAINDGFPEGVWLNALFRFLFNRRYLTVVFQGDDDFLSTRANMHGARSAVITRGYVYGRQSRTAEERLRVVGQYRSVHNWSVFLFK